MNSMYDILNKMKLLEGKGSKPDFLDLDKDGNKKEPMKKAAKEVDESVEEGSTGDYSAKKARAGKDIGKPGKTFAKIAKSAGERYGSKERGEKVAGAVLAKLRAKESIEEADVEEGNDFTGARLAAIRAGKPTFKVDGKTYKVTGDTSDEKKMMEREYGQRDDFDRYAKKGDTIRTAKGTLTKTDHGVKHERRPDDEEETAADAPKRGRGRPKGKDKGPERVTSKAWKHKGGRVKEGMEDEESIDVVDKGEYDREGDMAREQLHTVVDAAKELHDILDANENLPEWVQSKITKALDYLDTARDYVKASDAEDKEIAERELTKPEMAKREKYVKSMKKSKGDFEKRYGKRGEEVMYATATKMAKKKAEEGKEEVEETTVAGSVATAPAPKGKKGGMQFGKGVYESKLEESYKSRLEQMLTEGMSVNMSMDADGKKNLTVSATDEDAVKLSQILTLAGMEQGHGHHEVCPACGQDPCGCEADMMEEDLANAPDEVYAGVDLIKNQGDDLHKRKSTGQSTTPVIYRGVDRQTSMAQVHEQVQADAEKRLWDLYKKYEGK